MSVKDKRKKTWYAVMGNWMQENFFEIRPDDQTS